MRDAYSTIRIHVALVLIAISFSTFSFGQTKLTSSNFETEILNYQPVQTSGVTKKSFDFASMVIRETKLAVKDDDGGFNRADYYNVLTAFLSLKESDENIQLAFEKLSNSDGACEYFTSFGKEMSEKETFAPVRAQFKKRAAECEKNAKPKPPFILSDYCNENGLSQDLVSLIQILDKQDRKYRESDYDNHINEQKILDIENQLTIDSLFTVHGEYVGESLVGPKFSSTMWAVIQHSNEAMMKKYLPVLKQAVADGEIGESTLKMTIDRYYALAYGYQVFGSQSGMNVDLATIEKRNEIARLYGIEN